MDPCSSAVAWGRCCHFTCHFTCSFQRTPSGHLHWPNNALFKSPRRRHVFHISLPQYEVTHGHVNQSTWITAMSTIHRVKVYTWKGLLSLRNPVLITTFIFLAYKAALQNEPTPTKLHIRCVLTPTSNTSAYYV
jgi:hypothetical protein